MRFFVVVVRFATIMRNDLFGSLRFYYEPHNIQQFGRSANTKVHQTQYTKKRTKKGNKRRSPI